MNNILIWFLLLYSLNIVLTVLLKLKPPPGALLCGLVGFCGKGKVNSWKLKILLLYNKERGEDSTGIVVDNKIYKRIGGPEKLVVDIPEILEQKENNTVIGHTRAASHGIAKTLENAHPFAIRESKEDKEHKFFLAMNGTIRNMYELEKIYEAGYSYNDSDTRYLTFMLYMQGKEKYTEVLKKYTGAATLLYYWREDKNTLMAFKDPERPLFYYKAPEGMYISSLETSLKAIGAKKEEIHSFEDWHVHKIVEGKIIEKIRVREVTPPVSNFPIHNKRKEEEQEEQKKKAVVIPLKRIVIQESTLRYMLDKEYYTGKVKLNADGDIFDSKKHNEEFFSTHYIFFGYICKGEMDYDELCQRYKNAKSGKIDIKKFKRASTKDLSLYLKFPIKSKFNNNRDVWYQSGEIVKNMKLSPLFCESVYEFDENGKLVSDSFHDEETVSIDELFRDTIYEMLASGDYTEYLILRRDVFKVTDTTYSSENSHIFACAFIALMKEEIKLSNEKAAELLTASSKGRLSQPDISDYLSQCIKNFVDGGGPSSYVGEDFATEEYSELSDELKDKIDLELYQDPKFMYDIDNCAYIDYPRLLGKWSSANLLKFHKTVCVILYQRNVISLEQITTAIKEGYPGPLYSLAFKYYNSYRASLKKEKTA